jgi:hypothetical protein
MNRFVALLRVALIGAMFVGIWSGQLLRSQGSDILDLITGETLRHISGNGSIGQVDSQKQAIIGKWCLVDFAADETKIPEHGMYLALYAEGAGYRGAVLNWATGEETMPLKAVQFDGLTLRLQLTTRSDKSQVEMPWLVMTLNNGRFEGYHMNSANEPRGPKLKLVRAR